MNAVALLIPGVAEHVVARDQPEYIPLPAARIQFVGDDGSSVEGVLTRWRPTDAERHALACGADIWLETITFGDPLQPVRLSVECPLTPDARG